MVSARVQAPAVPAQPPTRRFFNRIDGLRGLAQLRRADHRLGPVRPEYERSCDQCDRCRQRHESASHLRLLVVKISFIEAYPQILSPRAEGGFMRER